ncbi:hypothetical protein LOK49_LG07G00555 [Camellia lanceoleosa]|uniref:Uncharacterized protein n=1 Tax=Camellia lanceoleosa TaxID=1840588 RepID=A0ACC0GZS6_9ERIC|nr:hypothetical protein LOK49_LG07G00555 [Camellia lanceoleosa]
MHDCVEQLSDSVDQLRNSIGEMKKLKKGSNFDLAMNDIQTWVSAALTNDDTCTEGFAGKAMNGKVKYIVRRRIVKIAQLTSNALALINRLASLHEKPALLSSSEHLAVQQLTLCITSLSSHASAIQTSPQLLAHTALSVALNNTQSTCAMMSRLSQSHGLKPTEVAAMRDCVEQPSDPVDRLRKSIFNRGDESTERTKF